MIRRLVESHWFGLADLLIASLCGVLWYSRPSLGWWLLLVALAPWAVRLAAGRFPFRRTWFDLLLAIFLLTAAVGVWAAYDQERAWAKFWIIVSAVLLYYALVSQPLHNLWLAAGLASLCGVFFSGYFLLTHDWQILPADLDLLNRLALRWMSIRPTFPIRAIHPNIAGGLMAMLSPFPIAIALRAWRARRIRAGAFALAAGGLTGAGLLLTSSRAAWLALAAALGVWLLWGLSGIAAHRTGRSRNLIFAVAMLCVCVPAAAYALSYPGGLVALANKLPGLASGTSRLDLARHTFHLIGDFPFTGGGLGAFAGLYSLYVMIIPVFLFSYSHNFLLDVALEQGVFGFLALVSVMLGSAWLLAAQIFQKRDLGADVSFLTWAVAAGLIVVGLHGLVDDALYGNGGTPLLFLLTGMTVAVTRPVSDAAQPVSAPALHARPWRTIGVAAVVAAVVVAVPLGWLYRPLLASWYANLGAMRMARIELAGWEDEAVNNPGTPDLSSATALFTRSLQVASGNRTANHRLGLMAMQRSDFAGAAVRLEAAYASDQSHRGLNKALGYDYVWLGQLDRALLLLNEIPEARDEMNIYAWWWGTQGREDLAAQAALMVKRLDSAKTSTASQTP